MSGCRELVAVMDWRHRNPLRATAVRAGYPDLLQPVLNEPAACILIDEGPQSRCAWTIGQRTFLLHGQFAAGVPEWARDAEVPLEDLAQRCEDGIYNLVVWDRRDQRLLVCPDLFGFRVLYVAEYDGMWVISSRQRAVTAAAPATPAVDLAALAATLVVGRPIGDGGLFAGVRVLPTECAAVFSADGMRLLPRPELMPDVVTGRDLVDACGATIEASARTWLGTGPAPLVALSGGLDSRAALGAAVRIRADVETASWALPGAGDPRMARRLAHAARVPHHLVPVSPGPYSVGELTTAARETEALTAAHLPFYRQQWLAYLAERGRPVVHGLCGDTLSGAAQHRLGVSVDALAGAADSATDSVRTWAATLASDALVAAARPAFRPQLRESLGEAYAAEWTATPGDSASQRLMRQTIASADRRRVTLLAVRSIGTVAPLLAPYYSRAYIRFSLGVPAEDLLHRRLVRRTIARGYPALAAVPEAGTGRPPLPRSGLPGRLDRVRGNRIRWRLQPGSKPSSATAAFEPVILRHLPVFAEELRASASLFDEFLDVRSICTAWDAHDFGGLSVNETVRLFNTAALLRRMHVSSDYLLPTP